MNELSIIIPVYNEENAIGATLDDLLVYIKSHQLPWKVIVVNDGSMDTSPEILKQTDGIRLIHHPYNKGYGAALKTGINNAETEIIAFFDADGQHRPEDLEKMYENFIDYEMLIGQRGKDSHRGWMRRPGKWILGKTANFLTSRKIPDLNSGLRIIKKATIIKLLHLFPNGFSFSTTSTVAFLNMGFNVGYHPIRVLKRTGKSNVKQLKHGSQTMLLILRLIILFNPLKVFIPFSILLFILGLVYEILFGIIFFPSGFRLIPAAFFLLLTSVLIFFFGLVVDQVSEMRKYLFYYK